MKYYPISLALRNRKCVVAGAGTVAERKARRLLECGARVLVIGRKATSGLEAMVSDGSITLRRRNVNLRDLKGADLVIAATSDRAVNSRISDYCRKNGILVNVVDSTRECSFILPSVVRRGDLTISVSTGGTSPALAKRIRQDLEKAFGAEYGAFLKTLKEMRPAILKNMKSAKDRKKFLKAILDDAVI